MNGMDADPKARALFEQAARRLDADAAKRLRLARRAALARGEAPAATRRAWAPALALSAALALGLAWWLPREQAAVPPPPLADATLPAVEESVLAEAGDDADLYAWLAEAPVAADDAPEQRL